MSAVNLGWIYPEWLDSLTTCNSKGGQHQPSIGSIQILLDSLTFCNSKEDSISRQSSIDLFRYGWIHLQPAIVNEDSVSRQSGIDLFRYGWIHLPSAIVKEDSVSRQSGMDLSRMVGFTYILQ